MTMMKKVLVTISLSVDENCNGEELTEIVDDIKLYLEDDYNSDMLRWNNGSIRECGIYHENDK